MPGEVSGTNKNENKGGTVEPTNDRKSAVSQNASAKPPANNRRRRRGRPSTSNGNKENVNTQEAAAPSNAPNGNPSKNRRRKKRPAASASENPDSNEAPKPKNNRRRRNRGRGGGGGGRSGKGQQSNEENSNENQLENKGRNRSRNKTKFLYEFKCACGQSWINSTPSGECRKCKIMVEPHRKYEKKPGLTPYQGPGRTYGSFRCPECDKLWTSAFSWANYGQECKECLINVYPFQQRPFLRDSRRPEKGTKKPHPQELCGKCTADGSSCTLRGE